MPPVLIWVVAALSLVGVLISSYFTGVAYHVVSPDTRWVPSFCRMGENTCASIVFTPRARVFALPNSVLGQLFYVALLAGCFLGWISGPWWFLYIAASAVTVGLGIYLTYSLFFVTRVRCPLCLTSHAINLAIFVLLGVIEWHRLRG